MTPARYLTAGRVAELAQSLSERDRAIIATLDRLRLATTDQLGRLHVMSTSQRARLRRTQAILAKLLALHIVARLDRQVGGVRAGSAGYIYALDVAGQRLASVCGPAGGTRIRRPWTPGVAFIAHQLAVTELYVRLHEAEKTGSLDLLAFDAEPLCWRTFTGIGGARVTLKPDAFVRVGLGEYEDTYFIEVDRATHSLPAITRKLTIYRSYFQTGREQERFGVFPQALLLAPSAARRAALTGLLGRQPVDVRRLAAVALFADAAAVMSTEGA